MKKKLVLSLGSNLGNRYAYLLKAKEAIELALEADSTMSGVYSTPPWGDKDQPSFLNTAIALETDIQPQQILAKLQCVEQEIGKRRIRKWGPRCIDIDIILLGDAIHSSDDLSIPHPLAQERAFVLAPLRDIVPDMIHPVLGLSIRSLFSQVSDDTTIFA